MDTARVSLGVLYPAELTVLTSCERILEHLLETQKFENTEIDRGMEPQAAFVGTKGRVELHTEATVHLNLAFVIFPSNSELDDPFWNCSDLESFLIIWVLFEKRAVLECRGELCNVVQ